MHPSHTQDCYHGGAFYEAIGETFSDLGRARDIIAADVLDAWFDPAPAVTAALAEHLPWILRTSPPTHAGGLVQVLADTLQVPPEAVLPGAGSSDLIFLALGRLLRAGDRVLILDPTYGEYAHVLERVIGCRVDRLRLHRDQGYRVDAGALERAMGAGYAAVLLVDPNSPTGVAIPRGDLRRAIAAAPPDTWVWVDETYLPYLDADATLAGEAARSRRLLVCMSMSKAYALSGARVAYLCGPPDTMRDLRRWSPPWAVSHAAQIGACAALRSLPYYRERWRETGALRAELAAGLAELGWETLPGVANFLLGRVPDDGPGAAGLTAACRARGLFLRDPAAMGRAGDGREVRVAVKDDATNRRMLGIIAEAMAAPDGA